MVDKSKTTDTPAPIGIDFHQIAETLSVIRSDVKDIKPKVTEARDGVIKLNEWKETTKERLAQLESKSNHVCIQEDTISRLAASEREASIKFATDEGKLEKTNKDIEEVKGTRRTIAVSLVGIALTVLGSVGGWIWTMATLRADVSHIQTNVGERFEQLNKSSTKQNTEVRQVLRDVKQAIEEERPVEDAGVQDLPTNEITVSEWWEGLGPTEKRAVKRALGDKSNSIPVKALGIP